jgi:ATP-dependent exoDNAse (exonuclease V) beta subunit
VRLAPHQAGIPLEFSLLEGNDALWLQQEALEELRQRLAARPDGDPGRQALIRRLVRLNNNWNRLAQELRELLTRRDSLGDFLELVRASREPAAYQGLIEDRLSHLLSPCLINLQASFRATELGRQWPEFWVYLENSGSALAAQLPSHCPGADLADLPYWQAIARSLLTQKGELRKRFTAGEGFPAQFKKSDWAGALGQLPAELVGLLSQYQHFPALTTSGEEVEALHDLIILLGEALQVYEQSCSHRGVLDFIALEQAAMRLLAVEDLSDLLLRLDCRLQHLLIDEFQDTSLNQMQLLCRLVSGWEPEAGRTVMVVGDPKQSIYGWRQAKLRLFVESRQGLPCGAVAYLPLEPLRLDTNFRATAHLITWVNEIFAHTVMAPTARAEVEFHPAAPRPGASAGHHPTLALFTDDAVGSSRELEARGLAAAVKKAVGQHQPGETIGVLLFTRTHLKTYLTAFHQAGLSVRVKEGLKLQDSQVVQHLHNLERALVRPQDELAWAALWRGPWGGLSLSLLAQIALTEGDLWPTKLKNFTDNAYCIESLKNLIKTLAEAGSRVGRQPLEEVLQSYLQASGAWEAIAAREGPLGVASARAYLDLVAAAESGVPEATFQQVDFNLGFAFQPPDPRAQDSPVEVLTVHGAKGLEFDYLFLPYLDWQPWKSEAKTDPFLLEEIPGGKASGLALARPYGRSQQSALYLALKEVKQRRLLAEARRVFYVAVTRARRQLFLSGVVSRDKKGLLKIPPQSPLGWLWQHYDSPEVQPRVPLLLAEPRMSVELFEDYPETVTPAPEYPELPVPWEFEAETPAYGLQFPSELEAWEEVAVEEGGGVEDTQLARIRGDLIHRLLDNLGRGEELPLPAGVSAALIQAGIERAASVRLAADLLAEVAACQQDPFLAPLLANHGPVAHSEWLLEDRPAAGLIRRGKIDCLVFDGREWWLLDYKTSRPPRGTTWEDFLPAQAEIYRPQLLAYREMAAKLLGIDDSTGIKVVLYFTAGQKVIYL